MPQNTDVYYARGNVYEYMNKYDLALADYNKIIEINPRAYKAFNNRGLILMRRGQFEQALIEFAITRIIQRGTIIKEMQQQRLDITGKQPDCGGSLLPVLSLMIIV